MNKLTFSFIIGFLCSDFSGNTQPNSLLWKIEAAHLSKPSYLYGTMHSRDKRAHLFGDSVLAKLNECDAVALELLTGSMKENPFAMITMMMMQDTTLDMLLTDEDYQLVKDYATENLELFSMFIDNIKPIFTSVLLTEGIMRNDKPYTVDEYFEKKAMDAGKKTISIESMEEQMNALAEISLREQAEMLVEHIKSEEKTNKMFEDLMEYYENQDLNGMMRIYKSEEMPAMFDEALVKKRNRIMAHRMDSIIRIQPTFNAVGALHLAGDEGLIELLKTKGYRLSPVFSTYSGNNEPEPYFPGKWVNFISKEGGFSMDFPGMPEVEAGQEKGKMNAVYKDAVTNVFFIAAYSDLSKQEMKNGDGNYDKGIAEMQERIDLIRKKEIQYLNKKAMDCEFIVMKDLNIRYRFLLVKNRMYMFGIGGSEEFINSDEADKFYDSLKLL